MTMTRNLSVELRPKTLDDFVGCESITDSIKEGVKQGRVDSTYLFFGPPGCGKTSMARAVFRFLNGNPKEWVEGIDLTEPDVSELDAETLRGLINKAQMNPWVGKYKGFIIDEAHKIRSDVQTILLKALEEPCATTIWFVCSSEPNKLSDAIRRRGVNYIMPSMNDDQVLQLVLSTIKKIGGEIEAKYLQTNTPTSHALAYDLAEALVQNEVSSPGFILRAVEKMITGSPINEAAQVTEVTTIDTFAVARATAKGDWPTVQKLLQVAPRAAAKDIRAAVAGYFRAILIKEASGSKRAERCVWAIEQMSALSNQNPFEEGLIWAATCASLYKLCVGQREYISKKE